MMLEEELNANPLVRAMLDPTDLRWNGNDVPRIPDGEFTETQTDRLHDEFTITTDSNGGFCVIVRACPWAAIATSDAESVVVSGDANFKAPIEFNAFAAQADRNPNTVTTGCGLMPAWTSNAYSISVINRNDTISDPSNTSLDYPSASALFAAAAAWRPVCSAVQLRWIGPVLTGAGSIASAHWPGVYKLPTTGNRLLTMNGDTEQIADDFQSGGPTYESVQDLVTGEISPAMEGRTIVWSPDSLSVQKRWRPVKARPIIGSDGNAGYGLNQVSNTGLTLEYILPPPCTGDPQRQEAFVDNMYINNMAVTAYGFTAAGVYGDNKTFAGSDIRGATAGLTDTLLSDALRNNLNMQYRTDMVDGDNAMIIIGSGLPPNTTVYTCECWLGVEYIADTRSQHFGASRAPIALATKPEVQIQQHAKALAIMHEAPVSTPGKGGIGAFVGEIVGGIDAASAAVDTISSVGSSIMENALPVLETLGALLL